MTDEERAREIAMLHPTFVQTNRDSLVDDIAAAIREARLSGARAAVEAAAKVCEKLAEEGCPHLIDESCCIAARHDIRTSIKALDPEAIVAAKEDHRAE